MTDDTRPADYAGFAMDKPAAFTCRARASILPEPQDCDWPFCGCDTHAQRVLESIEESGFQLKRSCPPADGWQPIATAPKDGKPILVWAPDDDFSSFTGIDLVWFDREWLYGQADSYPGRPTHWMPVPADPTQQIGEQPCS
jgi:hypothetical protein